MHESIYKLFEYIQSPDCPQHDKGNLLKELQSRFKLTQDRKILYSNYFAVRISSSKNGQFSNTVLSLSALQKYDSIPVFAILVSQNLTIKPKIFLINTTFLTKVSHSSQQLRMDNIKGSFNGSDIIREYHGIKNTDNSMENVEKLFAFHKGFSWQDNLERLVEATSNIVPLKEKVNITPEDKQAIYYSIVHAKQFVESHNFDILKEDLNARVESCKNEILIASRIENVNIRGRLIEVLITSDPKHRADLLNNIATIEQTLPIYDTKNGLGDYNVAFDNGNTQTDIKTKIIYLNSNPKAYNIDKFLQTMIDSSSVFLLFFVGIDKTSVFNTVLCSVYHNKLIDGTVKQFHWAGRSSRGVTQFCGEILDNLLNQKDFCNNIDVKKAQRFVDALIDE